MMNPSKMMRLSLNKLVCASFQTVMLQTVDSSFNHLTCYLVVCCVTWYHAIASSCDILLTVAVMAVLKSLMITCQYLIQFVLALHLFLMNRFLISPLIFIILHCLQDLLRCRILTRGIIETRFQVDRVNFQ